ncbi:MAG: exonuclease subunit SbcD [Muribaculaceae bacterium]|nr:exonuclease subunit SbcD [Muribaculaceae bacterium]
MKILATSDWHLGNLFHGNDRLPEHRHFLGWLISQIRYLQPDALLVAGDVFDNGNPSAAAQAVYYEFLAQATAVSPDLQIIITAGNHDSASRLEAPRAMLSRHNVEVRGAVRRMWVPSDEGGAWQTDFDDLMIPLAAGEGGRTVVLAVPYLRTDVVGHADYSAGVNAFLRELTRRARVRFPDARLVMMAHMYAKGSDIAPKDASEKIMIGGQEEVNMEGWTDHPDYLTCGHIHKRQHIWNTDWARYSGSVLPMSFAEVDYRHGVDLITFSTTRKPQVEFIEYKPRHPLRVIPADDEPVSLVRLKNLIMKEVPARPADGNLTEEYEYVALKVMLERADNEELREIEKIFEGKNAVLCRIQKLLPDVDLSTITDGATITGVDDILERDPLDTLRETFKIKHKRDLNDTQEGMLRRLLDSITNETPDQ